jgi:hypothetical protein
VIYSPADLITGTDDESLERLYRAIVDSADQPDPIEDLFTQQIDFVLDPAKHKAALCSRRAGKTHMAARYGSRTANKRSGARVLYVAITRGRAKDLLWDELKKVDARYRQGGKFNETEARVRYDCGSVLRLMGADNQKEIVKVLGEAHDLVLLDESAFFGPFFESFLVEAIGPTLADYDGTLAMFSAPAPRCAGYFHDVTTGKTKERWSLHHWTVTDNPCFPRWAGRPDWRQCAERFLAELRQENGWTEQSPAYLRQWRGRWVHDVGGLVYHYEPTKNDYDGTLPAGHHWQTIMGIDVGFRDAFAIVTWAWCDDLPDIYQVDEFQAPGLIPSLWAEKIKAFRDRHHPIRMVMDCGALGLPIAEEFRRRHGLPIEAAEKTDKAAAQNLINADFNRQRCWILRGSKYGSQLAVLPRDQDRPEREDQDMPNDLCDAGLYGWREAIHWAHRPEVVQPKPGSPEWQSAVLARMKKERMRPKKKLWWRG